MDCEAASVAQEVTLKPEGKKLIPDNSISRSESTDEG